MKTLRIVILTLSLLSAIFEAFPLEADATSIVIPDTLLPTPPELAVAAPAPTIPSSLEGYRKSDEELWWWNQAKKLKLNLNDTTVRYPKFLKFCLDVYKWGDHFFNSYDPEYVVGTGKRWKARIVNDNWADSYIMVFPKDLRMHMLSDVYANIGAYLQYMAVSIGYTYDMGQLANTGPLEHKKMEFGFNCALFNISLYYNENTGGTYLRKFGDYEDGRIIKERFPGVELSTWGIDAMYFFNHNRYSHGAAYNFSKIQKRSQGSWIAGFSYSNIKLDFDFAQLPLALLPYLTVPAKNYMFHYNSYAIVIGYGFNWVINPRLLFNATAVPSIGLTHCYEDSLEGAKYMPAINLNGQASLTYNLGNFFFSGIFHFNGHWYKSGTYSLLSSIENFSANIGFRF
ncbi:MAG: DUF4421 domain-containing protein [Bacteroides sp.]|nr:DUF4421 domain-containing protein [Bacteroides sp.]